MGAGGEWAARRVTILGPPGSGKGTQGIRLSDFWKVPHIASGDILRRILTEEPDSSLARAARVIEAGKMVPDAVAARIIFRELERPETARGFVLDGFPRNVAQAEMLDECLGQRAMALTCALQLRIDESVLLARLSGRLTCPECGESFQISSAPPRVAGICDRCGARLTIRPDDEPAAIRMRLRLYHERAEPLYSYYARSGRLRVVSADGTEAEVFSRCLEGFGVGVGDRNESLV